MSGDGADDGVADDADDAPFALRSLRSAIPTIHAIPAILRRASPPLPPPQMVAIASRFTRDGVRIVHLPSGTVFSNWPSVKTPLRYVFCAEFSPSSGYLALGNDRGRVLLYRVGHYAEA